MAIRERVENSTKPLTTKMAEEIMIWNTRHVVTWFAKVLALLLHSHDLIFLLLSAICQGATPGNQAHEMNQLFHPDTVLGSRSQATQTSCIVNMACPHAVIGISADRTATLKRTEHTKTELNTALSSCQHNGLTFCSSHAIS